VVGGYLPSPRGFSTLILSQGSTARTVFGFLFGPFAERREPSTADLKVVSDQVKFQRFRLSKRPPH